MKELNVKKNQTLRELIELIMETYKIKDVPIEQLRLRYYDPKLKVKLQVFDKYDMQLHKLNFHNHMDLIIEIK